MERLSYVLGTRTIFIHIQYLINRKRDDTKSSIETIIKKFSGNVNKYLAESREISRENEWNQKSTAVVIRSEQQRLYQHHVQLYHCSCGKESTLYTV